MSISIVKPYTLHSTAMRFVLLIVMLLSSLYSQAEEDILTIEGARIRGNQELPTILYLIPWQTPELQYLDVPQQSFAMQRPIESLERTQFQRIINYHQHFKAGQKASPATGSESTSK